MKKLREDLVTALHPAQKARSAATSRPAPVGARNRLGNAIHFTRQWPDVLGAVASGGGEAARNHLRRLASGTCRLRPLGRAEILASAAARKSTGPSPIDAALKGAAPDTATRARPPPRPELEEHSSPARTRSHPRRPQPLKRLREAAPATPARGFPRHSFAAFKEQQNPAGVL